MRHERNPGDLEPLLRRSTSPSLSGSDGKDEDETISTSRGAFIMGSIGLLIFLQATNISILTTTQSSIAADLDAFEKVSWLTSSYLIAMSSLAPLMGRLSQVFSPRLCMFFSTIVMSIGTTITASAVSFDMFIVGRVCAGVGGGGIFIVASILVIQMTSPKRRGLYIGLVNSGMTVGVSLGAVIAGALEPKIGWKPLFGVQAPLSLLAGFGLLFSIPANHTSKNDTYMYLSVKEKLARIDYSGALLLIATIVLFLLGLSGPHVLLTPLILSALALPIFILNEIYIAKDPIIPVSVLRSRGTLLTCLATTGFMMARWCILFYTPVYALAVRGWQPAVAGSILIPTNAGFASGGLLAGVFHIKRTGSFYMHSVISMGLFPLTMLVLSFISTPTSTWSLYVSIVFLNGLVTGASLNYALVHLLHLTLPGVHPIVLSLLATFRGFAGSFGSAIGGGLFGRVLHKSLKSGFADAGLEQRGDLIRRLLGSPALVGRLEGMERSVAVGAYQDALKALFLSAVGLSAVVVVVQACTGWKEPAKNELLAEEDDEEIDGEEGLFAAS
ncbi:MFS general substrate transporter [Dothidotthia symphoricarpi CBS 119687]|uniref:MFS general substrate transporter n=1 Tax=Dothidotthia symphoricarpi CBS 119687 TaxID=1392245 RepID=A0A6A6A8K9_9PLEO|nr:MFS general substrate transporter [Dothidotthia symphoricarpi CBS 119687]KAF2128199.1 MFS general substrate transporter [Dothidotthia symphoricarpi CBS 119687]